MTTDKPKQQSITASDILYWSAGLLGSIGLTLIVASNWDTLSSIQKILFFTLIAVLLQAAGVALSIFKQRKSVGNVFTVLGVAAFNGVLLLLDRLTDVNLGSETMFLATISVLLIYLLAFPKSNYFRFSALLYFVFGGLYSTVSFIARSGSFGSNSSVIPSPRSLSETAIGILTVCVIGIAYTYYFTLKKQEK